MNAVAEKIYYKTRSLCPTCMELVPGEVVARGGQVLVSRRCPDHGPFEGLVCSDQSWYEGLGRFDVEGVKPRQPQRPVEHGCPDDCGLCSRHAQIAGTAAVEISNHCNAACPTCLANNQGTFELGVEDVREALELLLTQQDSVDSFTLSGGEPTVHPQLFEMIAVLDRPEVRRIVINSNGVRIARDQEFVERLAQHPNLYVCLHYDGSQARRLRGTSQRIQEQALQRLCDSGVKVVPLILSAQGVNDHELGPIAVDLLARSTSVKSIILSMMTYTGSRGSDFPGDPMGRLTITGALDRIEQMSELKKSHFIPLPMPNPQCASIGYFMVMDSEITPLVPLVDLDRLVECTKNANFARVDQPMEDLLRDIVDRLYAEGGQEPLLRKFRFLLESLFPTHPLEERERKHIAEQYIKTVYLMQFMDAWNFDTQRLSKCSCLHLLPGKSMIPSCGYYTYHRRHDPRFATVKP